MSAVEVLDLALDRVRGRVSAVAAPAPIVVEDREPLLHRCSKRSRRRTGVERADGHDQRPPRAELVKRDHTPVG
jgi:hypothetical protein